MLDHTSYQDVVTGALAHPLRFASVSGAHLYGFPSPDSDVALRGCHVLPAEPDVAAVAALDCRAWRAHPGCRAQHPQRRGAPGKVANFSEKLATLPGRRHSMM